jgi:hypothetical protein
MAHPHSPIAVMSRLFVNHAIIPASFRTRMTM